jgi:hypothetical protein
MKMNKIKYAIISAAFVLGGMATGCDTLDIDNLNSYDESMVWDDVNLATAYVNNLYSECFGSDRYTMVFGYYYRNRWRL